MRSSRPAASPTRLGTKSISCSQTTKVRVRPNPYCCHHAWRRHARGMAPPCSVCRLDFGGHNSAIDYSADVCGRSRRLREQGRYGLLRRPGLLCRTRTSE